ncbi:MULTISPECIES: hypothetical protein [Pacificimonas]|uniref:Uncharacterized protein n=1 Tax=Pacificimonas aurantium TaxID=1250540 RepID=A0ABS7WLY4_9SPHN|nr:MULTISPECIES: hypothetical protein [Pacificimonas]MBZ6379106.1 hypothetical protein [Pacificimonas aurantium]
MTDSILIAIVLGLAIGLPMAALARAIWKNHSLAQRAERMRRYEAFNALLARIENKNFGPTQKIAAVRQLREFPEYRDLIVVMCNNISVQGVGPGVEIFENELKKTEAHLLKVAADD